MPCASIFTSGIKQRFRVKLLLKVFQLSSGGVQAYTVNDLYTVMDNANFKDEAQTVFYFYGLTQNMNSSEVVDMRNAYVSNGDLNFILFDLPVDYAIQVSLSLELCLLLNLNILYSFKERGTHRRSQCSEHHSTRRCRYETCQLRFSRLLIWRPMCGGRRKIYSVFVDGKLPSATCYWPRTIHFVRSEFDIWRCFASCHGSYWKCLQRSDM